MDMVVAVEHVTRNKQVVAIALGGAAFIAAGSASAETKQYPRSFRRARAFRPIPGINGNGRTSGFGRLSAYGDHSWVTERSTASIHGFVENTFYLKNYGSQRIFNVGADTEFTA